jgi:hypothetical protein
MTDRILYKDANCYVLHDSSHNQKFNEIFSGLSQFYCDDNIAQGPTKINGTKSVMYVVKDLENYDEQLEEKTLNNEAENQEGDKKQENKVENYEDRKDGPDGAENPSI